MQAGGDLDTSATMESIVYRSPFAKVAKGSMFKLSTVAGTSCKPYANNALKDVSMARSSRNSVMFFVKQQLVPLQRNWRTSCGLIGVHSGLYFPPPSRNVPDVIAFLSGIVGLKKK